MKLKDFRKIADDLASWGGGKLKVIRIIGFGEPLINRDTPRMVDYLKELDIAERIEITFYHRYQAHQCYSRARDIAGE
jgi:hypothetical protein